MIEELIGPGGLTDWRIVGAVLLGAMLVYWTVERLRGEGDDPTLRMASSSETGSTSMLVSGSKAVAMVAVVIIALLYAGEPIPGAVENRQLVLLGIGGVVLAHWIVEKEEVED